MKHVRGVFRALAVATMLVQLPFGGAQAHPHVFIDAGLQLHFDDERRLVGIRVVWVYDDFYSMLMIEELGLDPEFTGTVTDDERAQLSGFDMNWMDGYEGDLYPLLDEKPLPLGPPRDWSADYRDGRIISTHFRPLEDPAPLEGQEPLVVKVYDPTYYVAYTIATRPLIVGREDCEARIFEPDWGVAAAQLEAALDELAGAGEDVEINFPAVGAEFAEEARITCAGSS